MGVRGLEMGQMNEISVRLFTIGSMPVIGLGLVLHPVTMILSTILMVMLAVERFI